MAYRSPSLPKVRTLHLKDTERAFLRYRLQDIGGTAEAILHRSTADRIAVPYPRHVVTAAVAAMLRELHRQTVLHLLTRLRILVVTEAIEGNTYFVRPAGDPLLAPAAIQAANELRKRVEVVTGRSIARFKVGPPEPSEPSR